MSKFFNFVFNKKFWTNKWTLGAFSIIAILFGMAFTYLYNPVFIPQFIKNANKKVVDKIVGKELAERIDETRDENGATSIRTLFNTKKEENLERHCEKKEEKGKIQEKCYKTYKNEEFGFSVKYPVDWHVREYENGNLIGIAPQNMYEDNLAFIKISEKTAEEEIELVKNYPNTEILSIEEITLNGKNCKKITEKNTMNQSVGYYYIFDTDKKTFILNGDLQEEHVQEILDSFSFN